MGKQQKQTVAAIVRTEPTRGRAFRVNSADLADDVAGLADRVAALEAGLAEARANIEAI